METLILLFLAGVVFYAFANRGPPSSASSPAARSSRSADPSLRLSIELSDDWTPHRQDAQVSPEERARLGTQSWIPPGETASVGGFPIPDGMIYLGENLAPIDSWHHREPALIDPSLPVARRNLDLSGEGMDYWPSYGEIPKECRGAYLRWLAGGRSDPAAYIGYVFLFFYGLERRLLFDLRYLPEQRGEVESLLAELERLLSLYPKNNSFQGYGTGLLHTSRALWWSGAAYERKPSFDRAKGQSVPIDVRLAIGELATAGKPIPGEWALAWVVGHPDTRLKTSARRCPEEFRELFLHRFRDRFGAGMTLKPNKRRLKISYTPASPSFARQPVEIRFDHLPDVGAVSKPLHALREIAETASAGLESYSRFVGSGRGSATSLPALALLPPELAMNRPGQEADRLRAWLESTLGDRQYAVVTSGDVIQRWPCARDDGISKGELGSLSRVLGGMGCGIEPDPRFGGGALGADQWAVLFRLGRDRPEAATANYRAATTLLQLAAAVATSDEEVSREEKRQIEEHLERSMQLGAGETRRLRAHLQWLLASPPRFAGLKRRLAEIDERGRCELARFALAIAGADGVITPEEIKTLAKIYRLLGLDPDRAYRDIHALGASAGGRPADRPVTVRPPEETEAGYAISAPPDALSSPAAGGTLRLDAGRLEKTLEETAAVSRVLTEIFADQERPSPPPAVGSVEPDGPHTPAGLDATHMKLLHALKDRAELSREQFTEIAGGLGLLPEGAFETLNEVAFECADAPLLEGEERISIDRDALGEMLR